MIVYSIRCEECGSDYEGSSSDSAEAVRLAAREAGWSVAFPAKFAMIPISELPYWPAGSSRRRDFCPACREKRMREAIEFSNRVWDEHVDHLRKLGGE
jgi:hypothetical protein